MAITAAEIKEYKSTFSASGVDSLGGAITGTEITDNTTHNIWDVVSSAESSSGEDEYRCIYVKNTNATLTLQGAKVWIATNTPSADTSVEIARGDSLAGGTEQTVANEGTAPTLPGTNGTAFSTAAGEGNAITLGDIGPASHRAIWIKRHINAGAGAYNDDNYVLSYSGDTAA